MIIDILFSLLLVWAIIKGFRRGLIVGVFSFLSIIIGLAAAIKLSAVVAGYIGKTVNVSERWLPILSFVVVFIVVVLLIRLGANLIQKAAETAMLGWLNRLGGIIFYSIIVIIVFSVLLFYAEQIRLLKPESTQSSVTYSFLQPWGPRVINGLGSFIPFFRDMFGELERFFGGVAQQIPPKQ